MWRTGPGGRGHGTVMVSSWVFVAVEVSVADDVGSSTVTDSVAVGSVLVDVRDSVVVSVPDPVMV
eukprot:gene2032-24957_t